MFAQDILRTKGSNVITVTPEDSVSDVARLFVDNRIGFALVMGPDQETYIGTISERDVVHGLALSDGTIATEPVSRIMTTNVVTCAPDTTVDAMMRAMTEKRTRHLLIMDGPQLKGVVSIGDMIKSQISEYQVETEALREYVSGSGYH